MSVPNFSFLACLEVAKLVRLARLARLAMLARSARSARLVRLKVSCVMLGWLSRSNECLCQISAS